MIFSLLYFDLYRKLLPYTRRTKQEKFREKNGRFVVSEFVKICDEHITDQCNRRDTKWVFTKLLAK